MFVEIVTTLSSLITTGLGIQASKNKGSNTTTNKNLLSYNFTAAHAEVQQRIDRILGSGFYTIPAINSFTGGSSGYYTLGMKPDNSTGLDANKYTQFVEFPTGSNVYISKIINALDAGNFRLVSELIAQGKANNSLRLAPFSISSYVKNIRVGRKGWGDVSYLSSKNNDEAAQKIFNTAVTCTPTNCPFGKALQFGTPNDTYKAYSYPSFEVAKQYGENLSLFVHCNSENLGCQWFGKNINASFTTIILFFAGVALTIATVGVGTAAILSTITSLASQVANFVGIKSNDIDKAGKVVTEAVNIVNGADIEVKNGTKQDVINISNKIISVVKP